ncbi:MAG: aminopeptidase P family protein [Bacteroidaceae bacterium]
MKQDSITRVENLRTFMKAQQLDAFILPSTDAHLSEYPPAHWKSREWISGFNGSAGVAVVTLTAAALWTDSRYFIAADQQLEGTPFELMKDGLEGTPTIAAWLASTLPSGCQVGLDGEVNSHSFITHLRQELTAHGITVETNLNPIAELWNDRPPLPTDEVKIQSLAEAGVSCREKLAALRAVMESKGTEALLVSALDEVAWLLNLRGTDVPCNPVFVSYVLVTQQHTLLYINKIKVSEEVESYLQGEGVNLRPYAAIYKDLMLLSLNNILLSENINEAIYTANLKAKPILSPSPLAAMKAIKNETEIEGFKKAMLRDGVAMIKFLRWLKPAVEAGGETELSVSKKLSALRAEQPRYCEDSFETISAYQAHAALVHYEPTPATDSPLRPEGILLLDSGAQYEDGTTDITRTLNLGGTPTDEQKHDYTLVLKGHIQLSRCKFPEGASGTQLDICARYAMWQEGRNFGHGTGHGVGSHLCVHEGPHQIRMNYMPAPLKAGMTVTNEPGLYLEGKYGIRIENTLLVVPFKETEFGTFVGFEPLTLCPLDTTLIERSMLSVDEVAWINDYHFTVRNQLIPLLTAEERRWVEEATRPIL